MLSPDSFKASAKSEILPQWINIEKSRVNQRRKVIDYIRKKLKPKTNVPKEVLKLALTNKFNLTTTELDNILYFFQFVQERRDVFRTLTPKMLADISLNNLLYTLSSIVKKDALMRVETQLYRWLGKAGTIVDRVWYSYLPVNLYDLGIREEDIIGKHTLASQDIIHVVYSVPLPDSSSWKVYFDIQYNFHSPNEVLQSHEEWHVLQFLWQDASEQWYKDQETSKVVGESETTTAKHLDFEDLEEPTFKQLLGFQFNSYYLENEMFAYFASNMFPYVSDFVELYILPFEEYVIRAENGKENFNYISEFLSGIDLRQENNELIIQLIDRLASLSKSKNFIEDEEIIAAKFVHEAIKFWVKLRLLYDKLKPLGMELRDLALLYQFGDYWEYNPHDPLNFLSYSKGGLKYFLEKV